MIAHANPFAYGDWTYLEGAETVARAEAALRARGATTGVFGHTHRARIQREGVLLCNAGSIGQPRNRERASTFLLLELDDAGSVRAAIEPVHYDVDAHLRRLRASSLSPGTVARLTGFFTG